MIAIAKRSIRRRPADWQQRYLELLPAIKRQARYAFRKLTAEARDEAIADVIANTFHSYCRLLDAGKESLAYSTPLARFAIAQYRDGRRVGCENNVRDVCSPFAQAAKRIVVERLDQFDRREGQWRESLIEDRKTGPAETAVARIDIGAWFRSLSRRRRKIAKALARGETTSDVARLFRLTPARISQLRRELLQNWSLFQGELDVE
jgi:DNA-binding NarL/FixJ family response regulator